MKEDAADAWRQYVKTKAAEPWCSKKRNSRWSHLRNLGRRVGALEEQDLFFCFSALSDCTVATSVDEA